MGASTAFGEVMAILLRVFSAFSTTFERCSGLLGNVREQQGCGHVDEVRMEKIELGTFEAAIGARPLRKIHEHEPSQRLGAFTENLVLQLQAGFEYGAHANKTGELMRIVANGDSCGERQLAESS